MSILYNCHRTELGYRITKFNDGNVEASYACTHEECECPAGHRQTCRHRQMLNDFLLNKIVDCAWFLDWDNGRQVVDFQGMPQSAYNSLIGKDFKPAKGAPSREDEPEPEGPMKQDTPTSAEGIHVEEDTPLPRYNKDYSNSIGKSPGAVELPTVEELRAAAQPWRRI